MLADITAPYFCGYHDKPRDWKAKAAQASIAGRLPSLYLTRCSVGTRVSACSMIARADANHAGKSCCSREGMSLINWLSAVAASLATSNSARVTALKVSCSLPSNPGSWGPTPEYPRREGSKRSTGLAGCPAFCRRPLSPWWSSGLILLTAESEGGSKRSVGLSGCSPSCSR